MKAGSPSRSRRRPRRTACASSACWATAWTTWDNTTRPSPPIAAAWRWRRPTGGLNFNLAVTLARQGKLDEARELLKTDTRANPWHSSGHLVLATIFEQQNFRVPAVMSYLHFLALEQSPRASNAAARLQRLLNLGVETKGKETKIAFAPNSPKEEGDYGPMAMALALVSAGRSLEEKEKLSEFEKTRDQIAFVIALFLDQTDKHDDYTAAVQRPFFAAMQKEKLIGAFAAIAAAPLQLNGTTAPADLQRYQQWIAPQQRRPAVRSKRYARRQRVPFGPSSRMIHSRGRESAFSLHSNTEEGCRTCPTRMFACRSTRRCLKRFDVLRPMASAGRNSGTWSRSLP